LILPISGETGFSLVEDIIKDYLKELKDKYTSSVINAIKHTLRLMPQADRLFRRINLNRLITLNPRFSRYPGGNFP